MSSSPPLALDWTARRVSYRSALSTLATAVLIAVISNRLPAFSPFALLLLSPILFLFGAVGFAALDLWLTWWTARLLVQRIEVARAEVAQEEDGFILRRTSDKKATMSYGERRRSVPPLIFTSPAAWSVTQTRASWETTTTSHRPPFPNASPKLSSSLDDLLALIMRDFVCRWYDKISDSPVFPNAVERTIRETLGSLGERLGDLDWSDVIVGKILPLVTTHVETFRTAEHALRGQDLRTHLTESDELDLFLASRYASEAPLGKLHAAVDVASPNSRPAEEAWLSGLVGKILPLIMPEREAESTAVRIMAREIVACAVILPVIELLSDPDFWNKIIDEKAGAAIRDQKMVNQFREALDKQGSALSTNPHHTPTANNRPRTEEISARTDPKQFSAFVRGIGKCNSLLDARRLRNDVGSQIRKTRALVEGKSKDNIVDDQKVSDLLDYIGRLEKAKRKADKRIEELGGIGTFSVAVDAPIERPRRVILRDILLQPTALSYFTEFQDRRRKSLRVQFWLLVEGIKEPLEAADSDSDEDVTLAPPTAEAVQTNREDMKMIWDAYFSTNSLGTKEKYLQVVRAFIDADESDPVAAKALQRVRRAVFAAQHDVFADMEEEDFPAFLKSDLYYKAIAELPEAPAISTSSFFGTSPSPSPASASRPRSISHPHPPPLPPRPSSDQHSPSPATRTISSPLPNNLPLTTAPPKVTLHPILESRPPMRRSGSDGNSPSGSLASLPELGKRRTTTLSDSLDFLMSPPGELDEFRSPLFTDDDRATIDVDATPSNFDGTQLSDDDYVQVHTIEAIQEALNSILATDAQTASQNNSSTRLSQPEIASRHFAANPANRKSLSRGHPTSPVQSERQNSLSNSKSLLEERRRSKGVFGDEEAMFDEDFEPEEEVEPGFDATTIRLAAPGDLQLPVEIARIEGTIEKLRNQEAVVGALIRKAELTGNASELKILVKSRDSLRREARSLSFQKNQYELQSESNKLVPGRTSVTISGTTVGQTNGQSFQLYLVELHQLSADGSYTSGWIVTRRYSEFATLHANLKEKYAAARQLDLPSKRLVTPYGDSFIEQRRSRLEKYLQALVRDPVICQSGELRSFLSQQNISLPQLDLEAGKRNATYFPGQGLVRSFYRTVTSGIDEMFSAGPSSMMDTIIQRLSQQAAELSGLSGIGVQDEDLVGQLLAGKSGIGGQGSSAQEGMTYFTAPICNLFVTLFELKEKNNWLRRQAILIILQQVLGGTIERKFRDGVKLLQGSEQLVAYIGVLRNALWPGGQLKPKEPPRTPAQRAYTRDSANRKLSALMPDVAANLIGRANARQGARRLFAVIQNRRLNRHLLYSVIDEVCLVVFPELSSPPSMTISPGPPIFG